VAVLVVAGIALPATACTAAKSGPVAARPAAPEVIVLKEGADNANGDIFITPAGGSAGGPEIISHTGQVIWFHRLPAGISAADFRTQTYQGHPVLTWWQGPGLGAVSGGTDYVYNDHYRQIAEVKAGNGYSAASVSTRPAATWEPSSGSKLTGSRASARPPAVAAASPAGSSAAIWPDLARGAIGRRCLSQEALVALQGPPLDALPPLTW